MTQFGDLYKKMNPEEIHPGFKKSENLDKSIESETDAHHNYHQMADEARDTSDMEQFILQKMRPDTQIY